VEAFFCCCLLALIRLADWLVRRNRYMGAAPSRSIAPLQGFLSPRSNASGSVLSQSPPAAGREERAELGGSSAAAVLRQAGRDFGRGAQGACREALEAIGRSDLYPLQEAATQFNISLCRLMEAEMSRAADVDLGGKLKDLSRKAEFMSTFLRASGGTQCASSVALSAIAQCCYNLGLAQLRCGSVDDAVRSCVRCIILLRRHIPALPPPPPGSSISGNSAESSSCPGTALHIVMRRIYLAERVGGGYWDKPFFLLLSIRLGWLLSTAWLMSGAASRAKHGLSMMLSCPDFFEEALSQLAQERKELDEDGSMGLESAYADNPLLATTKCLLGVACLEQGDTSEAEALFADALAADPGCSAALLCLDHISAHTLTPDGDGPGATSHAAGLGGESSRNVAGLLLQGCHQFARKDLEGALKAFRTASDVDGGSLEAAFGVSRVLLEAGELAAAREVLIRLGMSLDQVVGGTAPAREADGMVCAGLQPQKGGGTLIPASPRHVMWRLARTCARLGDWKMSCACLDCLAGADASAEGGGVAGRVPVRHYFAGTDKGPEISFVFRAKAFAMLQRGGGEALKCLQGVRDLESDPALLLYKADALLCSEVGQEEVAECTQRALTLLDRGLLMPEAKRQKKMNAHPGKKGEGSDDSRVDGARAMAHNNLALVLVTKGELFDACRHLRNAMLLAPTFLSPPFNLTLVLWRLKKFEAATKLWMKTRGFPPDTSMSSTLSLLNAARRGKAVREESAKRRGESQGFDTTVNPATAEGDVPDAQKWACDVMILTYFLDHLNDFNGAPGDPSGSRPRSYSASLDQEIITVS
jgi:tetratricopeptide (TPR) repeat protein